MGSTKVSGAEVAAKGCGLRPGTPAQHDSVIGVGLPASNNAEKVTDGWVVNRPKSFSPAKSAG